MFVSSADPKLAVLQTPPEEAVLAKGMPADRFDRVRSTVRENIGWSLVMVTTHPPPTPDVVSRLVDGELAPRVAG